MITLLDGIGLAVWRASWQASMLALVIVVLLHTLGERVSPRWRYLFWSVVVVRLLFVVTPGSPWSPFNLVRWNPAVTALVVAEHAVTPRPAPERPPTDLETFPQDDRSAVETESTQAFPQTGQQEKEVSTPPVNGPNDAVAVVPNSAIEGTATKGTLPQASILQQILCSIWLAGCLWFGVRLCAAGFQLRRRLSICRPVTDPAVLALLETAGRRFRLKRIPTLLVTPESISPCLVGTWNPQIVLPESLVTGSATEGLRHVLAHELAHLVRGDLWTNWLLLTARVLHWFNPIAWWTVREMQAEREAACDELALASFGQVERRAYAATILDLAATLAPSSIAPGMIGLFSSTCRLKRRVERLARTRSIAAIGTPLVASALFVFSLIGLTDSMPPINADQAATGDVPSKSASVSQNQVEPRPQQFTLRGRCVGGEENVPVPGVRLRLFKVEGWTLPAVEIAKGISDREGRFAFADLVPPRPDQRLDTLKYVVTGQDDLHPIAIDQTGEVSTEELVVRMQGEKMSLSGTISNSKGEPVAGAIVMRHPVDGRAIPGILTATTDIRGNFEINDMYKLDGGEGDREVPFGVVVVHPDYPETTGMASDLHPHVAITLPDGCEVTGAITDSVTRRPAVGAVLVAQCTGESARSYLATCDQAGRFRAVIPAGHYNFLVEAKDRVCVAITGRECLSGEKLVLPQFQLVAGGLISGQVLNTATGRPITFTNNGEGRNVPIQIALYGPSQSQGKSYGQSPLPTVHVDDTGHFLILAAAGENFPYFFNIGGDRMAWNTKSQPPIVVKEGETVTYNMLVTPPVSEEQKLKDARQVVAGLSPQPAERADQILVELRKLKDPVGENILWCMLLKELVAIGPDIVPQLCAELDRTDENAMFSRLGFALRAIGDPRAVPALIRALPKTLDHPTGGFLTSVNSLELATFMQQHDLHGTRVGGSGYFFFARPVSEICGALQKLTGQRELDADVLRIRLSDDPRRQRLQRRLYVRAARSWETWWETHCREFTWDPAYQKVNLQLAAEALPPTSAALGPHAKFGDQEQGVTLSPVTEEDQDAHYFYDLDTGIARGWPPQIPKDAANLDDKQLAAWAAESGVDLMCVIRQAADGSDVYVLRSFGMKVWEISPADLKRLDTLITAGKLPEGPAMGELLMHYDSKSRQPVAGVNATFIYVTREGCVGLIEVTDQVTHKIVMPPVSDDPGYGLYRGVRFNLKSIIP